MPAFARDGHEEIGHFFADRTYHEIMINDEC